MTNTKPIIFMLTVAALSMLHLHIVNTTRHITTRRDALAARYNTLVNQYDDTRAMAARASNPSKEQLQARLNLDKAEPRPVHRATATAYSCNGITTAAARAMNCPNGITAAGTIPRTGRTAACPPEMLGQVIDVAGYGRRVCEDTGGAITAGRIDLYVENIKEAREFGIREVTYTEGGDPNE